MSIIDDTKLKNTVYSGKIQHFNTNLTPALKDDNLSILDLGKYDDDIYNTSFYQKNLVVKTI